MVFKLSYSLGFAGLCKRQHGALVCLGESEAVCIYWRVTESKEILEGVFGTVPT